MKSLLVTLLIIGAAIWAHDVYFAKPWDRLVFQRQAAPAHEVDPTVIPPHVIEDSGPVTPMGHPPSGPADDYVVKISELGNKPFVPPVIPSLDELTKNWSTIPASAFPRAVKLHRNVDVKMAAGSARIPAGATAYARSSENGFISVAPTPTSTAWGTVPTMDTDLPDQIRQSYEKWKAYRIESAHKAWLAKKTAKASTHVEVNAPIDTTEALDSAGKPRQANDGTYPLLLASMKAGDVTDITQPRIRRWGAAEQKVIKGTPLWVVDVWYETVVYCGPTVAQAQAQIRDGKVIAWVYPGSGEPVP